MPGSYTWLKNGKCQLFVSNGTGLGGKRDRRTKVVSAKDDEEAEKLLALFYADVVRGKVKDGSNMKLRDYIDLWIKNYVEKELEPKTIDSYKSEIQKRIVPALGHIKLRELKPLHLLDFYNNLQEDGIRQDKRKGGLSNKTISYYHRIISSALQTAVMWNLLDENPAQRVKPPKVKKKEAKFYDKGQAIELLNALAREPLKYQVAVLLDITTALRRGELLALDWTDLNTETTRIVDVYKSSQYIPGKGIFTKDPKNESSIRKGIIPKFIIPVILEYKKEQEIQRNKLGDKWISKIEVNGEIIDNNRIFTQWNGKPMYPGTLSHWFTDFIARNNLPPITFHGLRHTSLTLLIEEGKFSFTSAARVGGHANGQTTATIYSHSTKDTNEKAADVMEDLLSEGLNKPMTEQDASKIISIENFKKKTRRKISGE